MNSDKAEFRANALVKSSNCGFSHILYRFCEEPAGSNQEFVNAAILFIFYIKNEKLTEFGN